MRAWDWGVPVVYAGLLAGAAGVLSILWPLRFLGIRSRRAAAVVALAGALLAVVGIRLPAPVRSSRGGPARLDAVLPEFQFHEFHETRVRATPEEVFQAIRPVTAPEIRFFRVLTWLRSPHLGGAAPSILAPPEERPVLETALRTGFLLLAEEPGREIVFGTVLCRRPPGGTAALTPAAFAALSDPGYCKAAMNFRVVPEGGGFVKLTTETRILALGDSARRRFAAYWRLIYPGSALIRREWLDAIRRRAERHRPPCTDGLAAFARPVDEALAAFEKQEGPGDAVLAQALLVRGKVETAEIDPACAAARREVLVYFNHLILGFQGYLREGLRDQAAREKLDAIVRRARAHEMRGLGLDGSSDPRH
ncbi:MAG TPA: hypothetical protein VKG01_06830 [Thermoanaerobaculia bacterium]|nr:hypothetical protein [Thermoanaerobaculia bacterium]